MLQVCPRYTFFKQLKQDEPVACHLLRCKIRSKVSNFFFFTISFEEEVNTMSVVKCRSLICRFQKVTVGNYGPFVYHTCMNSS